MAELPSLRRRAPLSRFSQTGRQGGLGLAALADIANEAYEFLKPAAVDQMEKEGDALGREMARRQFGDNRLPLPARAGSGGSLSDIDPRSSASSLAMGPQIPARGDLTFGLPPVDTTPAGMLRGLIDRTEGAGRYDTLFGHAQRRGGRFSGVDVSKMTLAELARFTDIDGDYGQWVKGQVGRVATPLGRYQIVGTTLRKTAEEMGLPPNAIFDAKVQEAMFEHLARRRISGPRSAAGKREALRQEWEGFKHVPDEALDRAIAAFEAGGMEAVAEEAEAAIPPSLSMGSTEEEGADGAAIEDALYGRGQGYSDYTEDVYGYRSDAPDRDPGVDIRFGSKGPAVTVRNDKGALEGRLYSPLSGEILQAHNAAAKMSYLSGAELAGRTDMAALGLQYENDPDGLKDAIDSYIENVYENAPDDMASAIRQKLEVEGQRQYLGAVDAYHSQVRQEASNSNKALVERYTGDFRDALATGDESAIAEARASLEEALYARESLPGLAWTREQSENVMLGAFEDADRVRARRQKERSDEWEDDLDTIITAHKAGRTSDKDYLAEDPEVIAAHPELARQAQAMMAVSAMRPGFAVMPPDEQRAILDAESDRPIGEEWELDIFDAFEDIHEETVERLNEDPVSFLREASGDKPPELDFSTLAETPDKVGRALQARRDWAHRKASEGYTPVPTYFDEAERAALSALVSDSADPTDRMAAASVISQAFGGDARRAMNELGADRATRFMAGIVGAGGDPAVMRSVLLGQKNIAENLVRLPPNPEIPTEIYDALPTGIGARHEAELLGSVREAALALYASKTEARGLDHTSDEAQDLFQSAVQEVLGRRSTGAGFVGGIQEVNGQEVLLPPNVTPYQVTEGLNRALPSENVDRRGRRDGSNPGEMRRWVGNGRPSWNGEPITREVMENARFVPIQNGMGDIVTGKYRIEIVMPSGVVTDVENEAGHQFIFDMRDLTKGIPRSRR